MVSRLLTRDDFRVIVLARHGGRCCVPGCALEAVDAHHILNRNLFRGEDEMGGYYEANGANLCSTHHLEAEHAAISVEDLRDWCGITAPVIPEHFAADTAYDTWGNPILADGTRLRGELFHTDGCQKALRASLHLYQMARYKYPRTFHAPWSPGRGSDDKVQHDLSALRAAAEVVVTLKMDGEATSLYSDGHSHARSVTPSPHPSREHIRALAARIAHDLPPGWRVCGENMKAVHSIEYQNLPGFFLLYSIWDEDRCMPWDDTVEWAALLDLPTVPVLHRGPMPTEKELGDLFSPHAGTHEGYVIRDAAGFTLAEFQQRVVKWVRPDHVQTDQHWVHQQMRSNRVAGQ